jgi:tetratricopeptide (TPR) repeat protein
MTMSPAQTAVAATSTLECANTAPLLNATTVRRGRQHRNILLLACVIFLGTVALYLRTAHFGFVNFDDADYVYGNPYLAQGLSPAGLRWALTSGYAANWFPVNWTVYLAVYSAFGAGPAPYHVVNFLLHALNAALLAYVLWRMTGSTWASAAVAALFAWHPLRAESVAWISETKDVLGGSFAMLTLLAYVIYAERPNWRRYLLVVIAFLLAVASKPTTITLPALLLLLDFWPLNRTGLLPANDPDAEGTAGLDLRRIGRLLLEKIPLVLITAGAAVVTYVVQTAAMASGQTGGLTLQQRIVNAVCSVWMYVRTTVFPTGLAAFYPHPYFAGPPLPLWKIFLAVAVVVFITAMAVRFWRSMPFLLVGWLWFFGMLVTMIGLVQVGEQARADRYTYLPGIGLVIAIVWLAKTWVDRDVMHRRRFIVPMFIGIIFILLFASWLQIGFWRNSTALFEHADQVTERNHLARALLAMAAVEDSNPRDALRYGQSAVEACERDPLTHHALAKALQANGQYPEALNEYRIALERERKLAQLRNDLGGLLDQMNRPADAIAQFQRAIELDPLYADAHNNLGNVLAEIGKIDQAVPHWQAALRSNPNLKAAHGWLATALERRGDRAGAVREFRAALAAGERRPQWMADLAWLLATDPRCPPADAEFAVDIASQACDMQRGQPLLLDTLAAAQARAGRFDDATATAARAVELANAAGQTALAKTIQTRMMIYRAGRPFDAIR